MSTPRNALVLSLFALVACGGATKEYDSAQMQATGKAAGQQTSALGQMEAEADDTTIQSNTQALGGSFQTLVSQHQSESALTGFPAMDTVPSVDEAFLAQDGGDTYTWDGTRLVVNWNSDDTGFSIAYNVDMTFAASGDGQVIDGTYSLLYSLDLGGLSYDYDIDATYNAVTTDAAGCVVSGSFDVSYDISLQGALAGVPGVAAGDQSGRVVVTFNGCDAVTITGT